jgi:hypothetical protein
VAPLAVLGLLSGALALAGGGDDGTPEPLPLLAGSGASATARQGEAATLSAPPAADMAKGMPAPMYWGGLEIRVEGDLPDLGPRATAWDVTTPDLDAADAARMATALGLRGEPIRRENGWVLETGEGNFTIWPTEPGWSISFFRSGDTPAAEGAPPEDGEQRARQLLERLGVLDGEWRVESQETQIGIGWACAEPAMGKGVASADSDAPPPDRPVSSSASCPPPPPPVHGMSVTFTPLLDGRRADWSAWSVVLGPGGTVQNLSGTWARFERRGDYDLRPVSAALDELRSGGAWGVRPMMAEGRSVAPALGAPEARSVSASDVAAAPDIAVAPMPCPMPLDPAVKGAEPVKGAEAAFPVSADCPPPKPTVVTVTDVELGLLPAPGWDGQRSRLYLVPAYRFLGHLEDGSRYEAPVVALAPDAIAPPPAFPDKPMPMPMPMPMPEATPSPAPAPRD